MRYRKEFVIFLVICVHSLFAQKQEYATIGYLESFGTAFDKIVPLNSKIEIISKGHVWTEGPVWIPVLNALLFSDVPKNIAYKWTEKEGTVPFLYPSGFTGNPDSKRVKGSNGMFLNNKGLLILCQTGDRKIASLEISKELKQSNFKTITDNFKGKKYNSTNDLVVDSKGNIYFTDPNFGLNLKNKEIKFSGVYKVNVAGNVTLITSKYPTPNGIILSPDEKTLYISNSKPAKLIAIDLLKEGAFAKERILFDAEDLWKKSIAKQRPDGMAIHKSGTIFMTGPDGVLLISPKGKHLGTIKTDRKTSNCTFNKEQSILYITCDDFVLRIALN
ncbi:sugar lactone lactonase YvrE [Wenyingzhuangia heitensis]|uniref:Sugar lactone lactonase YvrE n=1 Tax=Wenyingzhuangia heitensis TaxID=1487859 RepID=A0ABX0U8J1_9FLAO|nr:SMP-30/gluconolactonase/LRE family protein [Wenyingzhuangia heitensis]NIJ44508.1 sugar lactone lactonase YvrE [Wenyingzhuangia heitensis]